MRRANLVTWLGAAYTILCLWLFLNTGTARADWLCAAEEPSCKTAFIVYSSWHAAIVLSRDDLSLDTLPELADFSAVRFIEFSWGDRDYFPDPNSGISAALRAAFWSGGSVLHLVGFSRSIAQFYGGAEIIALRLAPQAQLQLIRFLAQSFARPSISGRAPARPGLYPYSRFYPATGKFSILRTCNTWVAEALAAAGLPISPGNVLTAGQLAGQLADIAASK